MTNHPLTIDQKIKLGAPAEREERAAKKVKARNEAQMKDHLNIGEKVALGAVTVFWTAVLLICVFLTIVGFIFSPILDTLVFGLLMGATGLTSYVIWRGRNAGQQR